MEDQYAFTQATGSNFKSALKRGEGVRSVIPFSDCLMRVMATCFKIGNIVFAIVEENLKGELFVLKTVEIIPVLYAFGILIVLGMSILPYFTL